MGTERSVIPVLKLTECNFIRACVKTVDTYYLIYNQKEVIEKIRKMKPEVTSFSSPL